jgi:tetratricopeptide (TPR) repeat protein
MLMTSRAKISASIAGLIVATGFFLSAPASALSPQQLDWCKNMSDAYSPDLRIQGCTAAIQSGQWSGKNLAWAFTDRCFGYFVKRDYDSALGDCNQAIELDPDNAYPYELRGTAYLGKGDYSHAITDFNKAINLDPKSASAFYNRGNAKRASGDTVGAAADIAHAKQLQPGIGQ